MRLVSIILRTYHSFLFPTGSIQIFFQPPKRIGITRGTTSGHTAAKTPTITPTTSLEHGIRRSIIRSISSIMSIMLRIREWCSYFSERPGFGPGKSSSWFGTRTIIPGQAMER